MRGLILENCEKEELLSAITETVADHVLQLMTSQEAADLLKVSLTTIAEYKNVGVLTDYSRRNEHRKFSAAEVLKLRRMDSAEKRRLYARRKAKRVH